MKKFVALLIALSLFIFPVLSFAESSPAQRIVVKADVNESVLSLLVGDGASSLAQLIKASTLGFHTQPDQFCLELNLNENTIANLIVEKTEKDLLVGSNLLDKNAIQIPMEDIVKAMMTTLNTENAASTQISFDHTAAAVQESLALEFNQVETWDNDSDPVVATASVTLSSENYVKVINAVFEDFKASGIMDKIASTSGLSSSADVDRLMEEARKEIADSAPNGGNFLELLIGLDENGTPVYYAGDIYFVTKTTSYVSTENPNEKGEITYSHETVSEKKNNNLGFFAARHTNVTSQLWTGAVLNIEEGTTTHNGFSFSAESTNSGLNAEVIINQYDQNATVVASTLKVAFSYNNADFALTLSTPNNKSFADLLTLYGTAGDNTYKVGLALSGISGDVASITVSAENAELYDSIAGYEMINFNDLMNDKETQEKLATLVQGNLQGLLSF